MTLSSNHERNFKLFFNAIIDSNTDDELDAIFDEDNGIDDALYYGAITEEEWDMLRQIILRIKLKK